MERQEYTATAAELPQHLKRLKVPQGAIVHFWYEVKPKEAEQKNHPPSPQLKALLQDFGAFGGFTAKESSELKTHSQAFREDFDL